MKKILLIAVALIAMIGTAVANPAEMDLVIGASPNDVKITPDGSTVTTTDMNVFAIDYGAPFGTSQTRMVSAQTDNANLEIRVFGNGADTGWTSNTLASSTYTATSPNEYTFTVEVRGTAYGKISTYDNYGTTFSTNPAEDSASATGRVDIPEFPTIALPVAAILGLAFIFQRRREED